MSTVPMIAPDGSTWDIPQEQAAAAVKSGGKVGQDMLGPDGKQYLIPLDQVHAALSNGGQLTGAPPKPPKPTMQTDALTNQEQQEADAADTAVGAAKKVGKAANQTVNDIYDVSTPGIAEEIYKHMKGQPSELDKLPRKMVIGFLTAGGLGPEAEAVGAADEAGSAAEDATTGSAEDGTSAAKETPQEFVDRVAGNGRATVQPNAQGKVVDAQTGEPVAPSSGTYRVYDKGQVFEHAKNNKLFNTNSEGDVTDLRTPEEKAASQGNKNGKPGTPKVIQRGANKGQVKTYRVFDKGKWVTVPVYK